MDTWEDDLDAVQRDFLEDDNRRRIVELLAERPAQNISQIARELGVELNTARHHLDRLEAVDLVETRKSPREGEVICFLPYQLHLWETPATRILFGGSRVREAAILIFDQPGITADELAEAMGLTSGGIHHHIDTLLEHGLVERFQLGRPYRYYPTAVLEAWYEAIHG